MSMHLRIAAGACAMSTGLLIAGPAVAIASADTGSDGSASTGQGSARGPIGSFADSVGRALHDTAQNAAKGFAGTLSTLGKSGIQSASMITPPKMILGGTPTVHGSSGADLTAPADPAPQEPAPQDPAPQDPAPQDPAPEDAETAATVVKANGVVPGLVQPNVFTPPAPTILPTWMPSAPPVPPVPDVVTPVSNVVAAVIGSVASTPALLASLPTSADPISDVINSLQAVLTSVVDASTPLVQLPSDLAGLLGVATTIPAAGTGGIGSSLGTAMITSEPIPAPTTTLLPALPGFAPAPATEVRGGPATFLDAKTTGTATGVAGSDAAAATPAADASVLSVVERVIGVVVATVSITALLAVALPGILGLLGTCAAGIRIGYRQAKAGSELPDTAIARFVGSGPVGVVRSGSQISLRPRVARQALGLARSSAGERPARASLQLLDRAV